MATKIKAISHQINIVSLKPLGYIGALIDDENIGLIGYSMGGYGALISGGGGLTEEAATRSKPERFAAMQNLLGQHVTGSAELDALNNPALKAIIAIGPWGRNTDFFDAESLAGFNKPLMIVAGSQDDVSGYGAIRQIFDETTATDRLLLTFEGAGHNAGAPMPAPSESYVFSEVLGWAPFGHYADPVWDTVRMNNILQHFTTAFMDLHLKEDAGKASYLDLVESAEDGVWSVDESDQLKADHNYWKGFQENTARAMRLEKREAK